MLQIHVREIFEVYGTINSTDMPTDRLTGATRNFAYVEYECEKAALAAVEHMHGGQVDGQAITVQHVLPLRRSKQNDRPLPRSR